ncbi:hypothetical protein [Amycolatopsis sp. NPDC051071]|uniref:hypothetical protein n=1 Tax=Amycolatopsis sp. NPDC051071 TaxID=3154637 RepID=UPI0034331AD0
MLAFRRIRLVAAAATGPQQHRIEGAGHLRPPGQIAAVHIDRRDQAIADPQGVVAKVLESAAERAQGGGRR